MKKPGYLLAFIALLFGISGGYLFFRRTSATQSGKQVSEIKMPPGTIEISDCVPGMGFHYARPQDLPHGPIYMLHNGEVVGLEYMYEPHELRSDFPIEGVDLFGYEYEFMTVLFIPDGHEGYEVPHYDFHYYSKPLARIQEITCVGSPYEGLAPIPGIEFVPPVSPN